MIQFHFSDLKGRFNHLFKPEIHLRTGPIWRFHNAAHLTGVPTTASTLMISGP